MKVAIYSGEIPSTTFIENLIKGLADKNYTVLLFGIKKNRINYRHDNIILKNTPKNKILISLFFLVNILILLFKNKSDLKLARKVMEEKEIGGLKLQVYFLCKLLPILLNKPDVFHVQWIKGGVEWDFLTRFGIKLVGSFRGAHINYTPIIEPKYVKIYKKSFPKFDAFHAVSKSIAHEATKYGANINKTTVIPGAVSPSLLEIPISTKKSKVIRIMSVGRFHWKKGYNFALDACKKLKDQGIKFEYTIIGGVGVEDIPFQRRDLGLEEDVKFIDQLAHSEVLEMYKDCDLFLLPSVEEGIANVVLEAMSIGIPVISTNCGGMSELINNKNGWLVPVRDPKAICNAVIAYSNLDELEINRMIISARETIKTNHLIPDQIAQFDEMYQSIISSTK